MQDDGDTKSNQQEPIPPAVQLPSTGPLISAANLVTYFSLNEYDAQSLSVGQTSLGQKLRAQTSPKKSTFPSQ